MLFPLTQVYEFCEYARAARPTEETPRIEECIQLFNGLTIWVVCNILRELTIVKRAVIVEKFVDCTKVSIIILTLEICWRAKVSGC